MRTFLALLSAFAMLTSAGAQDVELGQIVDELNEQIQGATAPVEAAGYPIAKVLPEWGVAVKDPEGNIIDLFGQVPYAFNQSGELFVPGFDPPDNAQLELLPGNKWAVIAASAGANPFKEMLAPLDDLPAVVLQATDMLAEKLCGNRGRPSSITLSLVVGASGNIFFAEASTEAGSEVTWDLANDTCERYATSP